MDTATPTSHPEMVRIPARGRGTQRAHIIWRRAGKVRVELWTEPTWHYASRPSGTRRTLPETDVVAEAPVAPAFEPVAIGTSSQGIEWVAYSPEDVAPMREAFAAMESADVTVTAAELNLDFSVETMGFCSGVHMAPMFAKVWP